MLKLGLRVQARPREEGRLVFLPGAIGHVWIFGAGGWQVVVGALDRGTRTRH